VGYVLPIEPLDLADGLGLCDEERHGSNHDDDLLNPGSPGDENQTAPANLVHALMHHLLHAFSLNEPVEIVQFFVEEHQVFVEEQHLVLHFESLVTPLGGLEVEFGVHDALDGLHLVEVVLPDESA